MAYGSHPGDGQRPVCQKCITSRRQCDRSARSLKFIVNGASRNRDLKSASPGTFPAVNTGNSVEFPEGYSSPHSLPRAGGCNLLSTQGRPSQTDSALQGEFMAWKIGTGGFLIPRPASSNAMLGISDFRIPAELHQSSDSDATKRVTNRLRTLFTYL